jgi:hypothetical protein
MITLIDAVKAIINTVVRIMPLGFYMGTAMSGLIFSDFRGVLMFGGFLLNEMIALGYRMVLKGTANAQCALLMSGDQTPFILPAPITQTIGYFTGFLMADMYSSGTFNPSRFIMCVALLLITVYSRVNVGCKTLLDALYCAILGVIIGVIYYAVVKDYYRADYLTISSTAGDASISDKVTNFFSINPPSADDA